MQNYAPRIYMPQHSCWGRPDMANVKVWGAPFFNMSIEKSPTSKQSVGGRGSLSVNYYRS
jgi:hypothetical protein